MGNTSATYDEVKSFLDQMKTWLTFLNGNVVYDTRPKNRQFMVDMEWTQSSTKKEWLLKLEPEDYFEGRMKTKCQDAIRYGSLAKG